MEVLQDTFKDTKIGRIPKDWDVMMLNEITNYKSSNLSLNKLEENTGKYKLYGASGMLKGIDFYQTDKESFAIVKDGSGFGNLLWCDKNSSILGTLGRITNKEISDLKFCFYLTHTIKFKRYMSGSTIPHLYYKDYGNIKLPVPPLPEQRKIAAILSTVDELISTTDKIIEKSKELKKGLMQKLFSEGIGHTEFKDTKIGRIPKDWEVVLMKSVCEIKGGYSFKSNLFKSEGKYQVIRIGNLYGGQLDLNRSPAYIEETDKKYEDFLLKENDLISTMTGTVGKRDFGFIVKIDKEENLFLNQRVCRMRALMINSDFLYFSCSTTQYLDQFFLQATGGTGNQVNIGTTHIGKIKIALPPGIEQKKIADILSEADGKIEKEQTQKAQLEALKKGLMQQLLTGKKRVKV